MLLREHLAEVSPHGSALRSVAARQGREQAERDPQTRAREHARNAERDGGSGDVSRRNRAQGRNNGGSGRSARGMISAPAQFVTSPHHAEPVRPGVIPLHGAVLTAMR